MESTLSKSDPQTLEARLEQAFGSIECTTCGLTFGEALMPNETVGCEQCLPKRRALREAIDALRTPAPQMCQEVTGDRPAGDFMVTLCHRDVDPPHAGERPAPDLQASSISEAQTDEQQGDPL